MREHTERYIFLSELIQCPYISSTPAINKIINCKEKELIIIGYLASENTFIALNPVIYSTFSVSMLKFQTFLKKNSKKWEGGQNIALPIIPNRLLRPCNVIPIEKTAMKVMKRFFRKKAKKERRFSVVCYQEIVVKQSLFWFIFYI